MAMLHFDDDSIEPCEGEGETVVEGFELCLECVEALEVFCGISTRVVRENRG